MQRVLKNLEKDRKTTMSDAQRVVMSLDKKIRPIVEIDRTQWNSHMPALVSEVFHYISCLSAYKNTPENAVTLSKITDLHHSHFTALGIGETENSARERISKLSDLYCELGLNVAHFVQAQKLATNYYIENVLTEKKSLRFFNFSSKKKNLKNLKVITALTDATFTDIQVAASHEFSMRHEQAERRSQIKMRKILDEYNSTLEPVFDEMVRGNLSARAQSTSSKHEHLVEKLNAGLCRLEETFGHNEKKLCGLNEEVSKSTSQLEIFDSSVQIQNEQICSARENVSFLSNEVATITEDIQQVSALTEEAMCATSSGNEVASVAAKVMSDVESSADKIADIIGVIDDISFQTNLLALNAGIEAARAGDAGRGFAIVATEVRSLAEKSALAAQEIKSLTLETKNQVNHGVSVVGKTKSTIEEFAEKVTAINIKIEKISKSALRQNESVNLAKSSLSSLNDTAIQNANVAQNIVENNDSIHNVIIELGNKIREFQYSKPRNKLLQDNSEAAFNYVEKASTSEEKSKLDSAFVRPIRENSTSQNRAIANLEESGLLKRYGA